ncbi:unnamed protein product, partial [Urochloa humidicola]
TGPAKPRSQQHATANLFFLSLQLSAKPDQTSPPTGPDRACFGQPWLPAPAIHSSRARRNPEGGGRTAPGWPQRATAAGRQAGSGVGMGQAIRKLFDSFFSTREMRVVMLGLDAAGKTTILYRLHMGEVLSTVPTVGFNVEKVQYKNVVFTVWDVGGQEKLRSLWKMYLSNSDALIYVVDSLDRDRIGDARQEFQTIIKDPLMANSIILVFANKQDLRGAMSTDEVSEGLGLHDLRNRIWHIQGTCALRGEGLYDGLDWLASTLKQLQESGHATSVAGPSI